MEWYNILGLILGAFGGTAGIVSLYKAGAEKTGIDINNMQSMLDEAHKMFNAICSEKEKVQEEFNAYKKDNMQYITEFKDRFAKVEERLDRAETKVFNLQSALYHGYRCKYPTNIEDCPVLKEYDKMQCKKCEQV